MWPINLVRASYPIADISFLRWRRLAAVLCHGWALSVRYLAWGSFRAEGFLQLMFGPVG
jgi:hypothetical protein